MRNIIILLNLFLGCGCLFANEFKDSYKRLNQTTTPLISDYSKSKASYQTQHSEKTTGSKLVSLNFQDIKVRAVIQLLAEFTGINLIVSDKVKGSITLHLDDIPGEQALDIILKMQSLGKRRIGNIVHIAPIAEIVSREKNEFDLELERRNLAPLHYELLQINYAKAIDLANLLKDKNSAFVSPRGQIGVDNRTNTLWIQDTNSQLKKIREIIRQFDIPAKQVLIEARIVNVTKDFARDLGIKFGVSNRVVSNVKGVNQSTDNSNLNDASSLTHRLNFDLLATPIAATPASLGVAFAKLGGGILLDLELSALESEGRGEIISSPKLITTNQQTAIIEAGEEIPYQESTSSGATSVVFKKAVLSLKVTPQIAANNKILMDLHINQDIPSVKIFNGAPSILTKEINTNVLVNNGQTIVLGGIYKQDKYNAVNRVPFLGELPVVGALFKKQATTIRNEELLIFITPRIISNNLSFVINKKPRQAVVNSIRLDKFGKPVESIH